MTGIQAFQMVASGKLSNTPKSRPFNQPDKGISLAQITNPTAKRLMNAPAIALFLSSNVVGIIVATAIVPNTRNK
jgi:hypothetical protein